MRRTVFACSEEVRLRERYYSLILTYREMVTLLDNASSYGDVVETYGRAEKVRLLFDSARAEFLNHVQEHGCEVTLESAPAVLRKLGTR